jgi:superfamily II DNA or RNA helicase
MKGKLTKENQIIFNSLLKILKIEKKICTARTQGAGKSYLAAAFADEYERQGKNVLILTPNDRILDNSIKPRMTAKNVTYGTYPGTLSKYFVIPKNLGLIIVDEYHRLGGKAWRKAYEAILQANPMAHVLGLSAEHIRGDGRDMAAELFGGKIFETLSFEDAFINGYYKFSVKYIETYYTLDEPFNGAVKKLFEIKKIDPKFIPAQEAWKKIRPEWTMVSGVPKLIGNYAVTSLSEYFTPAHGRQKIAVFVESLDKVENSDALLTGWFTAPAVGFKKVNIHKLSSKRTKVENERALAEFMTQRSSIDELDILISVNMANEGLHIPGLNAILFLRGTRSQVLYKQQLGRCFDNIKTDDVIVFDFVGNIVTAKGYGAININNLNNSPLLAINKKEQELVQSTGGIYKPRLEIHRYGQSVINFINRINNLFTKCSGRDYKAEAIKMCERGNFEDFGKTKDRGFYRWVLTNKDIDPHAKMIWNNRLTRLDTRLEYGKHKSKAIEMCERGNFEDFGKTKDRGFYIWVWVNRNTDPHAKMIWENRLTTSKHKSKAIEMCERGNFEDFGKTKDRGFYYWVRRNKSTDPHAKMIWNNRQSLQPSKYKLKAIEMCERRNFEDFSWAKNRSFYYWVLTNKDTDPHAKMIWNNRQSLQPNKFKLKAIEMCERGNFEDCGQTKDRSFYNWVLANRDTDPHAKIIWENRPGLRTGRNKLKAIEMCERGNFEDFGKTKDRSFYNWVREHKDTDPHAKMIWENRINRLKKK